MGKRKYNNLRKANRVDKLPNFVSFKRLSDHMRNIYIGSVLDIHPVFTDGLQQVNVGQGIFRDLVQYCPRLASLLFNC